VNRNSLIAILLLVIGLAACASTEHPVTGSLVLYGGDTLQVLTDGTGRVLVGPKEHAGQFIDATVSAGEVLVVGIDQESRATGLFAVQETGGSPKLLLAGPFQSVAASADGLLVALTTRSPDRRSDRYDLVLFDRRTGDVTTLATGVGTYGTTVAWGPDSTSVTYSTPDGLIRSVGSADHVVQELGHGQGPSWSPDGRSLAYHRARAAYVRAGGKERKVLRRLPWQSDLVGKVYWNPAGTHISVNAAAGAGGKELTCLVVDVSSGASTSAVDGSLWCGPWVGE